MPLVAKEVKQQTYLSALFTGGFDGAKVVLGIIIGGLSRLVPSRFDEICSLTWKALWAATLATLMTGAFAGLFTLGANLK